MAGKRKLTIKQEAFARAYVETGNASEAYRRAYNVDQTPANQIWERASKLASHHMVSIRVDELRAGAAERHEVTIDSLTNELDDALKISKDEKQGSAMVSAIVAKAKLHGLMIEKSVNQNINTTIEDKPEEPENWVAEHSAPSQARTANGHMETTERPATRTH